MLSHSYTEELVSYFYETVLFIKNNHKKNKHKNTEVETSIFITNDTFFNNEVINSLSNISDESFDSIVSELVYYNKINTNSPIILNIGSGEGVLSNKINSTIVNSFIIDVDLSFEMLKTFDKSIKLNCNAIKLPIKNGVVDIITSHSTIRYISSIDFPFFSKELYRVLKENGIILISETIEKVSLNFSEYLQQYFNVVLIKEKKRMFRCSTFYLLLKELALF
jgi:SAM-dependent methyltransferase